MILVFKRPEPNLTTVAKVFTCWFLEKPSEVSNDKIC